MHIISEKALKAFAARHPDAHRPLSRWYQVVRRARWQNLMEARRDFPHADPATVGSGRTVIVFNIAGNKYRLISAIHFDRQTLFVLRILTHADYDKEKWKDEL